MATINILSSDVFYILLFAAVVFSILWACSRFFDCLGSGEDSKQQFPPK